MRRAAVIAAAVAATAAAGCGGGQTPDQSLPRGALAIYVSAPTYGPVGQRGRAVLDAVRRAVSDRGGRVAGRSVRVVAMSANRPGDRDWDPGTVEGNAQRAADDPHAIAYIGEADSGGSAVSLPKTNRAGILQVSPADGLTSLTTTPPGKPTAGPARYYPEPRRTFVTLVPPDLDVAREMLRVAGEHRSARIALVESPGIAQRELGGILAFEMNAAGANPVATVPLGDDPGDAADAITDLRQARPDAILLAGDRGQAVDTLLRSVHRTLPTSRLVGSPALADLRLTGAGSASAVTAVLPVDRQPRAGRRLAARLGVPDAAESLYAYDAARLVLDALRAVGPDRRKLIGAARAPRRRMGVTGPYTVQPSGSVSRARLAVVALRDGRLRVTGTGP